MEAQNKLSAEAGLEKEKNHFGMAHQFLPPHHSPPRKQIKIPSTKSLLETLQQQKSQNQ
jgi:hypothetical protein